MTSASSRRQVPYTVVSAAGAAVASRRRSRRLQTIPVSKRAVEPGGPRARVVDMDQPSIVRLARGTVLPLACIFTAVLFAAVTGFYLARKTQVSGHSAAERRPTRTSPAARTGAHREGGGVAAASGDMFLPLENNCSCYN